MIGQCNNTITYERRKNVLLGVTGTTSSQAASMLKEKTVFLQNHDQALLGKYFRDHLTKSLEAKKQSIEAIAKVSKSTNRKRPFREGPSFYQGRPKIQKFRSNYNDKYICSKRKEPSHSNSQILLPVMTNMEELTHVHPILKKLISKQKIPKCAVAGRLQEFPPAWKLLTKDQGLLALVEGYQIPLLMEPVQEKVPKVPKLNQEQEK